MQLMINFDMPGYADGTYTVRANDCEMVLLKWGNSNGVLSAWTSFACIPIAHSGVGIFQYIGKRAIPKEATCVIAIGISENFQEISSCQADIPDEIKKESCLDNKNTRKIIVISDLHLSNKPYRLQHTLEVIKEQNPDVLLATGDLVNDGTETQFQLLKQYIENSNMDFPIYTVSGNHDYLRRPIPQIMQDVCDYSSFQSWAFQRNKKYDLPVMNDSSGAYSVTLGNLDIIGLNATSHWRKFDFHDGKQIEWLKQHLATNTLNWHIILCHAPLLKYNPQQSSNKGAYLSGNKQLQEILDAHENILFLSGHTHLSYNIPWGCVMEDKERRNIYANIGTICKPELKRDKMPMPDDWKDGTITEIIFDDNYNIELLPFLIHTTKNVSRGYYQF